MAERILQLRATYQRYQLPRVLLQLRLDHRPRRGHMPEV
jgi:hypothetical protein